MYIKVDDQKVIFATHILRCQLPEEYDVEREKLLCHYQKEPDGIVIYPDQNVLDVEWTLRELKIPYTVEAIQPDPAHTAKAKGVKYASRSEAIEHFLKDVEPESQRLPNLMKRLAEREAEIAVLKKEKDTEIQSLKGELATLKGVLIGKKILT